MKSILQKFLFIMIFVLFPSVSFGAGSATFSYPPSVSFQNTSSGVETTVEGSITLQNATEDDFFLGVKIFQSATPPTQEQIDSSESLNFISTSASGTVFNSTTNLNFGTSYYFVFKIVPNGNGITGDVGVVSVNTPGTSAGGNTEPPCVGCAIDNNVIASGNYVGWPENVIENTLEVDDLNNFVVGLLNALIKIGIPVMVVFLVYSGLRLVMARGNEKELEDAKENLLWVIIGAAILLGGWTIVKVLKGTFDEIDFVFINSLINYFV